VKPADLERVQAVLRHAKKTSALQQEIGELRDALRKLGRFGKILGSSQRMQVLYDQLSRVSPTSATALLIGESGTGKELAASTIHELSRRRDGAFLPLNCGAVAPQLIESELFGHERGAFTGAIDRRAGCFELADGGTLFLDEIAEMDPGVQAKLLRVLQEGSFRRVGGKSEIKVNVRVIAATNRDPAKAIDEKQLREDLYYRLNVFPIPVPPLRERGADILVIAHAFIDEFNAQDRRSVHGITPEAEQVLLAYRWPGNVRELRNAMQRAVAMTSTDLIRVEDLPPDLSRARESTSRAAGSTDVPLMSLRELEHAGIRRALHEAKGDRRQAAELLGITPRMLNSKLADHGLS